MAMVNVVSLEHLLVSSDRKLFRNMQKREHCLNRLLPPHKDNDIELRLAGHDFLLPICKHELHRRSFVVRCLFNFFNCLTRGFALIIYMSICNRIVCLCHLIIKDYLLTYLRCTKSSQRKRHYIIEALHGVMCRAS